MGKNKDIREAVEAELDFDPLVDATDITVPDGIEATASDGNLTLTGTVQHGPQRATAEAAVAGLTGVRNIKDYIEVGTGADPIDADLLVHDALPAPRDQLAEASRVVRSRRYPSIGHRS